MSAGGHRVIGRGRILRAGLALLVFGTLGGAGAAQAASLELTTPAEAVEDISGEIHLKGTLDAPGSVFVFVLEGSRPCPASAAAVTAPAYTLKGGAGDDAPAGALDRTYEFTPPESGPFTACAFIAATASASPDASSRGPFTVQAPDGSVTASIEADTYEPGDTLVGVVTATSSAEDRALRVEWSTTGDCAPTPKSGGKPTPLSAGVELTTAVSTVANDGPQLALCAYVLDESGVESAAADTASRQVPAPTPTPTATPEATSTPAPTATPKPTATLSPTPVASATPASTPKATASPKATATPKPSATPKPKATTAPLAQVTSTGPSVPTLITPTDIEQFDRLHLRWRSDAGATDEVWIWDGDPVIGSDPVFIKRVESEAFDAKRLASGDTVANLARFIGFRQFWWRIKSKDALGRSTMSEVRTIRVIPSPLNRAKAKATASYRVLPSATRPGSVRLRVAASPRARVRITIRHNGTIFQTRKYTAGIGTRRAFDIAVSCAQQGTYTFAAEIRDPYGDKVTRRGRWVVSPAQCAG